MVAPVKELELSETPCDARKRLIMQEIFVVQSGRDDHIIPATLNYKNFLHYKPLASITRSFTEFQLFHWRDHSTIASEGWENVADFVNNWLDNHFDKQQRQPAQSVTAFC